MPKSVYSEAYREVVSVLVEARRHASMTQAEVAEAVGKDQSFISLIETVRRRVDIVEFCALARAMRQDPKELLGRVLSQLPQKLEM